MLAKDPTATATLSSTVSKLLAESAQEAPNAAQSPTRYVCASQAVSRRPMDSTPFGEMKFQIVWESRTKVDRSSAMRIDGEATVVAEDDWRSWGLVMCCRSTRRWRSAAELVPEAKRPDMETKPAMNIVERTTKNLSNCLEKELQCR